MELTSQKPRMIGQLNGLHEASIDGGATYSKSMSSQGFNIIIIEFVAMSVALGYYILAVHRAGKASLNQAAGLFTQAHGTPDLGILGALLKLT